ncbi:unnamed protein product, partial [Tetraodon nigroviridis]
SLLHELVSDSELSNLSPELQNKLEGILIGLQCKIDSLKGQHEQFRVDSEQLFFENVNQLAQCREEISSQTQERLKLKEEYSKLETELKAVLEKNRDHECAQERFSSEKTLLAKAKEELEAEKRELVRTLERRSSEVEHLNDDLKHLNDKLVEVSTSKLALQVKVDELESVQVNVKYKEKRMAQEKELLHGQTSWLNEELKAKSEELLSISRQKGNEILELKCKLENKEDEACEQITGPSEQFEDCDRASPETEWGLDQHTERSMVFFFSL